MRKQYLRLHGRPVLWWTLKAFENVSAIQAIVLVVPADDLAVVESQVRAWKCKKPVSIVKGGKERSDSVRNGLAALPTGITWVAVHDAVRPLVRPELIEKTLKAAQGSGAALAAYPSRDTVKLSDGKSWVRSTQQRETVWLAQTPQCFAREILERAHRALNHRPVTDDAQVAELAGVRVKLVEGHADNIKVTVPEDLALASFLLKQRGRKRA